MANLYIADPVNELWVPERPWAGGPPVEPPTGKQAILDLVGLSDPGALVASGGITISTDEAVVENLDIEGTIQVKANNVTVRNCRVEGTTTTNVIRLHPGYEGLVIENCVVIALPRADDPTKGPVGAIGGNGASGMTVRYTDVSGFADGIKAEHDSLYEYNYIHMYKPDGAGKHLDAIQGSGDSNWTVQHNVIDADIDKGGNAAVLSQGWNGANCVHVSGITVKNNFMRGGNYTVYFNGGKASCGEPEGSWMTDHHLLDNVFEGGYRFGHFRTQNTAETTISGNVDSNGMPLEF